MSPAVAPATAVQVLQWEKKSSQKRCTILGPTCGWSNLCNGSCNWSDLFDRPRNYSKPSDGHCRCHDPHDLSCGAVPSAGVNYKYPVNTFFYMLYHFNLFLFSFYEWKKIQLCSLYQALSSPCIWGLHLLQFLHSWPCWELSVLAVSWEYCLSCEFFCKS